MFDIIIAVTTKVWDQIPTDLPPRTWAISLLWTLYFLNSYSIESKKAYMSRCSKKSLGKWVWKKSIIVTKCTTNENFKKPGCELTGGYWKMYVGESMALTGWLCIFSLLRQWVSQWSSGLDLRYQIGVFLTKGRIICVHSPLPCRSWPNWNMIKSRMGLVLVEG